MDFAGNLKKLRKELKFSQQKLAEKLNVAQSTVGMWESGKRTPKLYEVSRMAKALNITIERLLSKHEQRIEVVKNEIYIDGEKVEELGKEDVARLIDEIRSLREKKKIEGVPLVSRAPGKAKKILIIDDDQEICEMLYSFLVPQSYRVFLTFNGQMGLEYLEEVKPDVVLLDLTLPDIEGVDVLRIIRKVSSVPVLIITGHPEDIAEIHLKDLRIEGYIEKPFSLEQILNTLKHLIGE
jgi:CheY-like chemotaxis protein/transcriptional regulator with XRE-family HTH domain